MNFNLVKNSKIFKSKKKNTLKKLKKNAESDDDIDYVLDKMNPLVNARKLQTPILSKYSEFLTSPL